MTSSSDCLQPGAVVAALDVDPLERESFAAYVVSRRRSLVRAAHRLTGDSHTAEDLVQSTLTSAYTAWPRIRDLQAADAYVRRAMANQHISWRRQRWRSAECSCEELPEPRQAERAAAAPSSGLAPDERAALWRLVRVLPPKQRAAIVLRFYEDMSESDSARTLGCSVGTIKSNTSRGLATLRSHTVPPQRGR